MNNFVRKNRDMHRLRIVYVDKDFCDFPDSSIIYVGPGQGFGSGRHPTTRMCLELLERLFNWYSPVKVLDAGTGTGILAVAAARLGARRVLAVEKERDVAETAHRNICLNRVQNKVWIIQGDIRFWSGSYDLILANLCPDHMMQMAGVLEKCLSEDGNFILSGLRGFEKDRALRLLENQCGLKLVTEMWDLGWSTVWLHNPRRGKLGATI